MHNPLLDVRPRPPVLGLGAAQQIKHHVLGEGVVDPCAARIQDMAGHNAQGRVVFGRLANAEQEVEVFGDFALMRRSVLGLWTHDDRSCTHLESHILLGDQDASVEQFDGANGEEGLGETNMLDGRCWLDVSRRSLPSQKHE